jgi:transcriptional regulator with XRE-family HTH domain
MRFGLARRLLGAFRGDDILPPDLARLLGKGNNAVYRWESGEDRPRDDAVEAFATLCREVGLPITAGWLERGEAQLPPLQVPAGALAPKPIAKPAEKLLTTDARQRRLKTPRKTRRASGG